MAVKREHDALGRPPRPHHPKIRQGVYIRIRILLSLHQIITLVKGPMLQLPDLARRTVTFFMPPSNWLGMPKSGSAPSVSSEGSSLTSGVNSEICSTARLGRHEPAEQNLTNAVSNQTAVPYAASASYSGSPS